jgi:hypothetical protein
MGGAGSTAHRTVTVGAFAAKALGGTSTEDSASLATSLDQVIRYYLADQKSGRGAWPYPGFLGDDRGAATNQLLQHAALYFAADQDSGRLARRIVEDLDKPGPEDP